MSQHEPAVPDLREDDVLLAELGRGLAALDPVPADALEAAVSAADLARLDDELADLLFDSLLDEPLVAMRSAGVAEARSLGFLSHGHRIDVELLESEGVLLGQLEPVDDAVVELESSSAVRATTPTDSRGRFRFDVPRGAFRLRITTSSGLVICTPWITW